MIVEEIKSIKSEKKDLRQFGITVGIGMAVLGSLFWWRGKDFYSYFLGISAALLFLGLTAPKILNPFQKVWMSMAVLMGWVMTRIILTVFFYLVITPIGLLLRMFGKDILNRKIDKGAQSYWVPVEDENLDK
ncbi:MAG: SxtJ family membrane protein, partial [bacterium]